MSSLPRRRFEGSSYFVPSHRIGAPLKKSLSWCRHATGEERYSSSQNALSCANWPLLPLKGISTLKLRLVPTDSHLSDCDDHMEKPARSDCSTSEVRFNVTIVNQRSGGPFPLSYLFFGGAVRRPEEKETLDLRSTISDPFCYIRNVI